MPLRTPLYEFHVNCGAKMVEYAGWEMPLLYRGITQEHVQTRSSGSMFDVSHMGRLHVTGKDAMPLLNRALTRNVAEQRVGQSRYSLVCNEAGGILDDVIVSKDARFWLVVCNAANRQRIFQHLLGVRDAGHFSAEVTDPTEATAMIAVQGPKVLEIIGDFLGMDLNDVGRYRFENGSYMMSKYTLFRSGYTGEDGVEIILNAKTATSMIKSLTSEMCKPDAPIQPAGLGARDTLRLEAGMPLYGHELSEGTDPLSAGLNWAVDLKKDFVGAEALRTIAERGPARKLVGIELRGPRIARQGTPVKAGDSVVGQVTSGTASPTLGRSIAMAYVDPAAGDVGREVQLDLRGSLIEGKVAPLPFYKRSA